MVRTIDLLKLPSLRNAYIAGGGGGIYKAVRRFEILEESYPAVVKFLEEGTFYLTTLWSMADDREGRLHLIEEMAKKRGAGIGIMPAAHLNNEIDQDILNLANENNFPVIYVPETARWGDLVAEYSVIANNGGDLIEKAWINLALDAVTEYHIKNDPDVLCKKMHDILHLPVIIGAGTVYSSGAEGINVAMLISRVQNIRNTTEKIQSTPVTIRLSASKTAIIYFGTNSIVVCCPDLGNDQSSNTFLFHLMAPFLLRELDNDLAKKPNRPYIDTNSRNFRDKQLYIAFFRFSHYVHYDSLFEKKYIYYDGDSYQRYAIYLIPKEENKSIYETYHKMMEDSNAELFIFSQRAYEHVDLQKEVRRIRKLGSSLLSLKGYYSVDELPLLYLLMNSPTENKKYLYSSEQKLIKLDEENEHFINTLRLYIVLHNMKDVSRLIGVHVNSVKYRIEKALNYFGMEGVSVSDLSPINMFSCLEQIVIASI